LPKVIRTDNGSPFAAVSATGLSRIAVSLIKLGITPERTDPGAPQQNGRHERMHRTLKAEATQPPGDTMRAQQAKFDAWRSEYNQERPHEALGMKTPASLYCGSPRKFPGRIPDFEYDETITKRKVRLNGSIRFNGAEIFISATLINETVALDFLDDHYCAVYAGFMPIAIIDLSQNKILNGKLAAPFLKAVREKTPVSEGVSSQET
jgi:hypothetical protein